MEQPREPKFYPNELDLNIVISSEEREKDEKIINCENCDTLKKMKDIMAMSYEAYQKANGNLQKQQELFLIMVIEEFKKMGMEKLIPYFTCNYDVIKREYKLMLTIPVTFCESDSLKSQGRG